MIITDFTSDRNTDTHELFEDIKIKLVSFSNFYQILVRSSMGDKLQRSYGLFDKNIGRRQNYL